MPGSGKVSDDIRWGWLTDEPPAPCGHVLLIGDDGKVYPASELPRGTELVAHEGTLPPQLHRMCRQAGYCVGSRQQLAHDEPVQRMPAERNDQTRLEDVLPEVRNIAKKVGGMSRLADIARTLEQAQE
jgi:hypothetical protein